MRATDFDVLTFDCYGTLIDWEAGILGTLGPMLAARGVPVDDAMLLAYYGELEAEAERPPWRPYREVLASVMDGLAARLGVAWSSDERHALGRSLPSWPPFSDTVAALTRLRRVTRIAAVSNIDDDLFDATRAAAGLPLDAAITAERCRSYKPDLHNFRTALSALGVSPSRLLHCGQSVYHDIAPARALGIRCVWVDRPSVRPGIGAVVHAEAEPHARVTSLDELAALLGA